MNVGKLLRAQLTIEEWQIATSTDEELINTTGKWKAEQKFYLKKEE